MFQINGQVFSPLGDGIRGQRQAERGAIKMEGAFEAELLAREEGTPSANDICISMSS